MKAVRLTVNGGECVETVEPRTHLADLLREKLNLTGTHLRCEQGACGACTVLIDGQPARSCITYAVLCDGAQITTIEGLEDDPVMTVLRRAFTAEHGLQCGFCTPGMLVTARDIVLRLPEADEQRVRLELSGNLCRCTGYVGIVRAIRRVLEERRAGAIAVATAPSRVLGPLGARHAAPVMGGTQTAAAPAASAVHSDADPASLGLRGQKPNIDMRLSFVVARPRPEVWKFFGELERVASCMPGATLTRADADRVQGQLAVKLGPIGAAFTGAARIVRDEAKQSGVVLGAGQDRLSASRASAEIEYALTDHDGTQTRVDIAVRALLLGPLAQFGRSGIVNDVAARLVDAFARAVERRLAAPDDSAPEPAVPIAVGSLLGAVIADRIRSALARLRRVFRP